MDEVEKNANAVLRYMQKSLDNMFELHGSKWQKNEYLFDEFNSSLAEDIACGYAGDVDAEKIDDVIRRALDILPKDNWRVDVLFAAQELRADENYLADDDEHN